MTKKKVLVHNFELLFQKRIRVLGSTISNNVVLYTAAPKHKVSNEAEFIGEYS